MLLVCFSLVVQDLHFAFIPATVGVRGCSLADLSCSAEPGGWFAIPWPAAVSDEAEGKIAINGVRLPVLGYEQDLIVS